MLHRVATPLSTENKSPVESESESDESDVEMPEDKSKDPDYLPLGNIFPTTTRRSTRLQQLRQESYSPTDIIEIDPDIEIVTPIARNVASPIYIHDSDEETDEFDSPLPKPIVIEPARSPSPFPFPRSLNGVALYPRDNEDPHLLEMTRYDTLNAWHTKECACLVPNLANETLWEFYHTFGACPLIQATNFLTESPKLIIEENNIEILKYYMANKELEEFVKAVHYLAQATTEATTAYTICKLTDSYLLTVHMDLLINHSKLGIFLPIPVEPNLRDPEITRRCFKSFQHLQQHLSDQIVRVKQRPDLKYSDIWLSSKDIDFGL